MHKWRLYDKIKVSHIEGAINRRLYDHHMTIHDYFRIHPKIVVLDFLICIDEKPTHLIEVKTSEEEPSKGFADFSAFLPQARQIQVVKSLKREKTFPSGVEVRSLLPWLAHLNLRPSE